MFLELMRFCEQIVSGIALPSGSDKLYTGSKDQTVRVWDCASGQAVIHFWDSNFQLFNYIICMFLLSLIHI